MQKITASFAQDSLLVASATYETFATKAVEKSAAQKQIVAQLYMRRTGILRCSRRRGISDCEHPLTFDMAIPVFDLDAAGAHGFGNVACILNSAVAIVETKRLVAPRRYDFPSEQGGRVDNNQG